jgi:type IV pilus assembly protein PilO
MAISADSITKLPRSKKVLIVAAVAVLAFFMFWYLRLQPMRDEIKNLARQRDQKVRELNESRAVAKNLEKFEMEVANLRGELNKALAQLPNEREIPELLKNISKVGKASNLEFLRFRPSAERPKQFYAEVPLELVFLGSYHEAGMFFDRVSKMPRIINVENFKMEPGKASGQNAILQTQCVATTFRFLEPMENSKK